VYLVGSWSIRGLGFGMGYGMARLEERWRARLVKESVWTCVGIRTEGKESFGVRSMGVMKDVKESCWAKVGKGQPSRVMMRS
jgi:hypothetical protein